MDYSVLGRTDIKISRICLGTMTFGQQNSEAEAFAQLDLALDTGVNFIDAAEMYPIPPNAATAGRTEEEEEEEIIGRWLATRRTRHDVVVATKITGPGVVFEHIRGGDLRHGRAQIRDAVDGSLRRLGTDFIDLYQIHWPDRKTNMFGQRGFGHDPDDEFTPVAETLEALDEQVRAGKIRAIGVSNETPWGLMAYVAEAERRGLPRVASIQNPYSLLNRLFEVGLAEIAIREECGLLAYSPLAFGTLSGKYLDGQRPTGARLTLFPHYGRYMVPNAVAATSDYVGLARRHGLDAAQMALAYLLSRPFLTSAIIGATTVDQLVSNLKAADLHLDADVVSGSRRSTPPTPTQPPDR